MNDNCFEFMLLSMGDYHFSHDALFMVSVYLYARNRYLLKHVGCEWKHVVMLTYDFEVFSVI